MELPTPAGPRPLRGARLAVAAVGLVALQLAREPWDAWVEGRLLADPGAVDLLDRLDRAFGAAAVYLAAALIFVLAAELLLRGLLERTLGRPHPGVLSTGLGLLCALVATLLAVSSAFELPLLGVGAAVAATLLLLTFVIRAPLDDLVSGLRLSIDGGLAIGDVVRLPSGLEGEIADTGAGSVRVLLANGNVARIRNTSLEAGAVVDVTGPGRTVAQHLTVTLHASVEPQRAFRILEAAAVMTPGVASAPAPRPRVAQLGPDGVVYRLDWWSERLVGSDVLRGEVLLRLLGHLRLVGVPSDGALPRKLELVAQLAAVPLFAVLSPEHVQRIAQHASVREAERGVELCREGDTTRSMFLLLEGVLRVLIAGDGEGAPATAVRDIGPGGYLGEMALLTGEPRTATVVAGTSVCYVELPEVALREVLQEAPAVADRLAAVMAERLEDSESASRPELTESTRLGVVALLAARILGRAAS